MAIGGRSRVLSKRVFIGALGTETNQFVPFPTGLRGYQEHGIWRGDATKAKPTNFTAPVTPGARKPRSVAGP